MLGLALGAHTALAAKILPLDAMDLGPTGAQSDPTAVMQAVTKSKGKLQLGLDTLLAEYQSYQEAVARGDAAPGTFVSQKTMARVIGDHVVIDAIAAEDAETLRADLEALGAKVAAVMGRVLSARLPLDQIGALQTLEALKFARLAVAMTDTGSVTTEGDQAQRSDLARQDFGVDGTGSTVGILSTSFDCLDGYAADIATGDLPADVNILDDTCPHNDEGRAMAQVVHDVAPGAGLAYHQGLNGQADFAQGVLELAAAGCGIIVDDIWYYAEPMFQDGVIAQAVDQVKAAGVSYFSSAGNRGRQAYEAVFLDSGQLGPLGGQLHDFDPGPGVDTRLEIEQIIPSRYIMQWQDPFFSVSGPPGAATDLDICFYGPPGATRPLDCAANENIGGDPVEVAGVPGPRTLEISIERTSGPNPDLVKLTVSGRILFLETYTGTHAGNVYGHKNAAGANAVGAVDYFLTPAFGEDPPVLNYYSSAGNTPILFDTEGNAILEIREKPQFAAPHGGNNTFFGEDFEGDGWPNFFGTSAAAPHAAAVAALLLEADPSLTPDEITTLLQNTAVDILERETITYGGPRVFIGEGYDNDSGAGLINAHVALADLLGVGADLSMTKDGDPDPVEPDSELTYTLTVTNEGPEDAVNVVVTDSLPDGVTFLSTSGCLNDPAGVPDCNLGDIADDGSAVYTIHVEVDEGTVGTITNTATITSDTPDPYPGNDAVSEDTTVLAEEGADLVLTKLLMTENPKRNQPIEYLITVTNEGPEPAQGVTVVDEVSTGATFDDFDSRCSLGSGQNPSTLFCDLGNLTVGQDEALILTLVSRKPMVVNTAEVSADSPGDPQPSNNSDTVVTTFSH